MRLDLSLRRVVVVTAMSLDCGLGGHGLWGFGEQVGHLVGLDDRGHHQIDRHPSEGDGHAGGQFGRRERYGLELLQVRHGGAGPGGPGDRGDGVGAVATLVSAEKTLFDALSAANLDMTKISPDALSGFNTPAVTTASQQVEAYLAIACGITSPTTPTT